MHEFYEDSQESQDEQPLHDERTRELQRFNVKIQGQETFGVSRRIKTTEISATAPLHESLLIWVKPPFGWCKVSPALCLQNDRPGAFAVKSDPF